PRLFQLRTNFLIAELRTGERAFHHIIARISQQIVVDLIADTDGSAAVSRRRLNEDSAKRSVEENFSVHDRVVSDTSAKPKRSQLRLFVKVLQHVEAYLLEPGLQAGGHVPVAIGQGLPLRAGRPEQPGVFVREYPADRRRSLVPGHVHAFGMVA